MCRSFPSDSLISRAAREMKSTRRGDHSGFERIIRLRVPSTLCRCSDSWPDEPQQACRTASDVGKRLLKKTKKKRNGTYIHRRRFKRDEPQN
jgi:hypothetical protein